MRWHHGCVQVRRYQSAINKQEWAATEWAAGAAQGPADSGATIPAHWGGAAGGSERCSSLAVGAASDADGRGSPMAPGQPSRQPSGAGWQQLLGQQTGESGWARARPAAQRQLPPAGSSWPGGALDRSPLPPAPCAEAAAPGSAAGGPLLALPRPSGGSEEVTVRMRSDMAYVTASEADRRARAQAEFQQGLRQQVEERAKLRAEEQQRWVGSCP